MTPSAHLAGVPVEELLPAVVAGLPAVAVTLRARLAALRAADRSRTFSTSSTPPTPGASR